MLEGLVASLLNRFLVRFSVKNFDPKQLNIGIWSGDVKLRKLELKREALDKFRLPIDILQGHLGELTLQIPWSNLKNKPVKVFIEDVYLLAVPKANQEYDEAEEERRKQLVKLEKLEDAELLLQAQPSSISPEEAQKNQSFTESLVTKIIDNLQITIKNIHFRYEDTISAPGHPFTLGITLAEFLAVSADQNWLPIFIQDNALTTHKLSRLESLAMYWNTDSELLSTLDDLAGVLDAFAKLIPHDKKAKTINPAAPQHQYVLKPVSGEGRITIHKGSASTIANSKAELIFDELGFILDEFQYRDALMMVDLFHFYIRTEQFKNLRPKCTVEEDPKQWFRFAGNVILREIHERRRQWTWPYFKERRDDRKKYIELFKIKSLADPANLLSTAQAEELRLLEVKLTFEDIRFYRTLAKSELRKEKRKLKAITSAQAAKTDSTATKSSWWGWGWGGASAGAAAGGESSSGGSKDQQSGEDSSVMTDQQRQELYDAIEWDEDQQPAPPLLDLPRDAIKMQLKVSLGMGSFALKRDPRGASIEILQLVFDTFSMNFLQRPDSFFVDLALDGLQVHDGTTEATLYPDIVRVKRPTTGVGAHPQISGIEDSISSNDDDTTLEAKPDPFFFFSFEKNPLDESADSSLIVKLGSMEIFYNKTFIEEIAQFFKPPKSHMESFGALLYAAGATVEGITNQTRAGLEYALQEHKTLNAKMDLQAPLIIIPSNLTEHDAPCMVLDAGHISIVSNLADKSVLREIQAKQSSPYKEEDYERLKSLMYDKFQLNLESTQVLVGPNVEETIAQLHEDTGKHKHFHIVDRINMNLLVEISIVANALNLTKFRVSGHLPVLHVSMSDVKYKILMQLISSSIPNLSFTDADDLGGFNEGFESLAIEPASAPAVKDTVSATQVARPGFTFSSESERGLRIEKFMHDEEDDDDDDDTFVEAAEHGSHSSDLFKRKDGGPDSSYKQRAFEFNFTVEKVQGSLYRGGPASGMAEEDEDSDFSTSHLLVDVILEHFELMFYNRQYDMHAEIILSKLTVEDRIEPHPEPEFSKLISSDSYYDSNAEYHLRENPGNKNLFHVKYSKVSKDSPEYLSSFDGIDQNIEVSIATLNFVITRKSILTLLDFITTTFSSPSEETVAVEDESQLIELNESDDSETEVASTVLTATDSAPEKMKLKLNLSSIVLVLNDDGVRLSTVRIDQADIGVFTMAKTIRVGGRIGNFALQDNVIDEAGHAASNNLISIQGDELADFRYETFDPVTLGQAYPGYNSSIYFRSGSIMINFVDESLRRILQFLAKFAEMKTLYDSARQAAVNQASQMKDPDKIHFDVIVRTPILVFSRECPFDNPDGGGVVRMDVVTVHLGELYIQNTFSTLTIEPKASSAAVNKINAGLRQTRITTVFHFPDNVLQELQMIENLDMSFKMVYVEHIPGVDRPQLEIVGSLSDVNLNLTESQYIFIIGLLKTLPATFQAPPAQVDEAANNMRARAALAQTPRDTETTRRRQSKSYAAVSFGKSFKSGAVATPTAIMPTDDVFTKVDFVFKLPMFAVALFLDSDSPTVTAQPASLSKLALTDTDVKLRMLSSDAIESEFHVKSFTIYDSRQHQKNRFREIVPSIKHDGYQFMASVSTMKAENGATDITAILSIDSPRFIFAIDYIFALKTFFVDSLQVDNEDVEEDESDSGSTLVERGSSMPVDIVSNDSESTIAHLDTVTFPEDEDVPQGKLSFRITIVDASVILIANPLTSSSEAVVLRIKEILMTQQNAFTLTLRQVGIYLCRMDLFEENRLRILDDFNLILSIDNNAGNLQHKTSINMAVEPLVLRLSLRDILLALSIVHKAAELSPEQVKPVQKRPYSRFSANKKLKQLAKKANRPSANRTTTSKDLVAARVGSISGLPPVSSGLLHKEELNADFDGLRLVLIGGVHELPLIDMCIKQFPIHVRNWSTEMDADASIEMFVNVYNYSKSAWEPLIEPWHWGFHMTRTIEPESLAINFNSRKTLELTITTQTISILTNAIDMMSGGSDLLSRPPDANAPYRIKNMTGFTLQVWVDNADSSQYSMAKEIKDGEEVPWRFDDWRKLRENLNDDSQHGTVGVRLKDSKFEAVTRIQANKEGEALYVLLPKTTKIAHRLVCEIKLREDKVKHITFRSALLVENNSQIPIEIMVGIPGTSKPNIYTIVPGEGQAVPIERMFDQPFRIRPAAGLGYAWSDESLYWRNFLGKYSPYITCAPDVSSSTANSEDVTPFYFQMFAEYNHNEPLTRVYPHMRIRISAPIEVQNLLPYDFNFMINDKNLRKEWSNFLRKGLLSPVHVVKLSHMLLMRVHMRDSGFEKTDYAVITAHSGDEFTREVTFATRNKAGQKLNLRLHYYTVPNSGGAFRVSIFSPYIILNKTGVDLQIKAGTILASSNFESEDVNGDGTNKRAIPQMFSYGTDDRTNRAILRVGESLWSSPQSFDAIGGDTDVVITSEDRVREVHLGIHVAEGQGKYKLTKIVTIKPRFIVKNKLTEDLSIREPGSSTVMTIKAGEVFPLHFMQQVEQKQLSLSFPQQGAPWSAPFNISDYGRTHVKVMKPGVGQKLLKIEILIEEAAIFLHIDMEKSNWPYSIRNFSNTEFTFYQANPYIAYDDEEEVISNMMSGSRFRPLLYRLPKKSVMPYSWDYPAAKQKELVICAGGVERHVPLAEIGNLVPMKLGSVGVIDINVVADGPIQTLVLSDYDASRSLYKPKFSASQSSFASTSSGSGASSSTGAGGFEVADDDDGDITFKAVISFEGIGVSLVNSRMQELCYITLRGFEFKYNESALYQTMSTKLKWIQVDNMLFGGIYPIVVYPSVVPQNAKEMENHPTLSASITRVKDESHGVLYVKYATILLQEMTFDIDEDFLFAVLDFSKVQGASWRSEEEDRLCDDVLEIPEPNQQDGGRDMYFEVLHIQPMQMDLSFVRTERVNAEEKTSSSSNMMMYFLNILTMAIGNINDAPVQLNALVIDNARVSLSMLTRLMAVHYGQQFLFQVHKIVGSADFLGNPVGLFNNLSSGVMDFFYEPYQGFIMNERPQELGIGLAKGSLSFLKKSVFGISDSVAKVTGSISKGLAVATLDEQFQNRRRISRGRNRPRHALYGVTAGASSFVEGLTSGITGIALAPMEGAKEGAAGFLKGLGRGLVGLPTKTAIGLFDLASNVSEGIRNTTTVFDGQSLDRVRMPRFIGRDMVVKPYSQREAIGQAWLKQVNEGDYFSEDYVAHMALQGEELVVIVTYTRMLMMHTRTMTTQWDVQFGQLQTVSLERRGIALVLWGGIQGPFVPITDDAARQFLYGKIGMAVDDYNKSRQALV
ncbi:uncharacterized protein V1518DRAFT_387785 [Limtongia smithiae]|uniref:uncharacterized protein n=1 Tax=Limtongia smithiae TaxID=1125753 RepID=UPI0034CF7987